jgi:hypothetical protein
LFDIESGALPEDWVLDYIRPPKDDVGYPVLSFPEWATDRFFYERLVDGDQDAVAVFELRRLAAEAA